MSEIIFLDDDDDDVESDQPAALLSTPKQESTIPATESTTAAVIFYDLVATTVTTEDAYMSYMLKVEEVNKTEHDVYQQARADLEKRHHEKVAKVSYKLSQGLKIENIVFR